MIRAAASKPDVHLVVLLGPLRYNSLAMSGISEKLLNEITASVAKRVAMSAPSVLPERYTLVTLSGDGPALDAELSRLAVGGGEIVAVADCPSGSATALATALARVPRVRAITGEAAYETDRLVASAERVLAPAMDLALASRVGAMQADSPAARVILRALLGGVPVSATLDDRAFEVSSRAPEGARDALAELLARLRSLGVDVAVPSLGQDALTRAAAAAAGVGRAHPSTERFTFPVPLNEYVEYLESRPCSIETGKPCVDCGACEARGF